MELSITTPALFFPAISLLMLAYTNRFLAIANLIRNLHDRYRSGGGNTALVRQINNLRLRIRLIRSMQVFGVLSFILCSLCMFCIFNGWEKASYLIFAGSLFSFILSLLVSLMEIFLSTRALEIELSDMEEITQGSLLGEILRGVEPPKH
jgi:hypothetical protein